MPHIGLVLLVFAATFGGVWFMALPPPIVVSDAQRGYALDIRAVWGISAREAERQAFMSLAKALSHSDDTYGAPDLIYQTRQLVRQRPEACLDGQVTATGFELKDKTTCKDKRGDDFNPYRRPFAFFKDGSHFSPPAGETFVAPKQSPKTGAPLRASIKAAVPRLRALDIKIDVGAGPSQVQRWAFKIDGADWTELEQAERQRVAALAAQPAVTPVALLDAPALEAGTNAGVCRAFREAGRVRGEINVTDSAIRFGRLCRHRNEAGNELMVVTYHKSRQKIRAAEAPVECAGLVRNLVALEAREGRPRPNVIACIGARFHEHDALDVDVNLFETNEQGHVRFFAS